MASDGTFYWIKLRTDFFGDDSPMDFLLSKPNGSEYVALYIKLCLATANTGGRLCSQYGEIIVPFDIEKIQRDMKFFSIDTVRVALELYKAIGLIYMESDGVLAIANHNSMVGKETKWAKYKRNEREGIGQNIGNELDNVQQRLEIRDKEIRDKEIRDEETRDREMIECSRTSIDYQEIISEFNRICISYPEVKKLSDARKKAIKARLKTYSLDDLSTAFEKAEASSFLKGSNNRNWSADFDWIMKDSNLAKLLDGNYDDSKGAGQAKEKSVVDEWLSALGGSE